MMTIYNMMLLYVAFLVSFITADHDINPVQVVFLQTGGASYYSSEFHGHLTASGEKYDQTDYTAAHMTLPFNTVVKVTALTDDSCSVVVRINDRGPYNSKRIIDLSKAAAEELDMIKDGVIDVKIEVIQNDTIK